MLAIAVVQNCKAAKTLVRYDKIMKYKKTVLLQISCRRPGRFSV